MAHPLTLSLLIDSADKLDSLDKLDHLDHLDKLDAFSTSSSWIPGELIGLVAVILIFGTPLLIVLALLRSRAARQRSTHELVMKLAEKGLPVPPELFAEQARRAPVGQKSELRSALTLIGVGVGVIGFFLLAELREAAGLGLIPLAIGFGQFIAWKIERGGRTQATPVD